MKFIAKIALLLGCALAIDMDASSPHARSVLRAFKPPDMTDASAVVPDAPDVPIPEAPAVFPVPTASRCVVIICCQYMIIYLALAICRTYQEFSGAETGTAEKGLVAAAQTVTYGPMLCVLFIACRMRVEFLSDGEGEPQKWVQDCMYAVTFAVMASTVLVLIIPFFTGKPATLKEGSCDLEQPQLEDDSKIMFYCLTAARYLIFLGLYGGLVGVIVGIFTYIPPGHKDVSQLPAPAPAVACTMVLALVFFFFQLIIAGCRSYAELAEVDYRVEFPQLVRTIQGAATAVEFSPQLCILFLAARMRALQHDAQPEQWVQNCMFFSTGALCFNAVMSIVVPCMLGAPRNRISDDREATFQSPDLVLGVLLIVVRYLSLACFYGGVVGVAFSIYNFEAPENPDATLPVSPTVHCVVILTCQYFFVYLLMSIMLTVSELSNGSVPMKEWRVYSAVESAKATCAFAPMLSILFVTTRMYALLITDKKGAPQAWVQDGMYMATWSLLISMLMCLVMGLITDVKQDKDGNVTNKFSNDFATIAVTAIRYLAMLLLYGGIVTVIVGLFLMKPETANGRGSVPVLSDGVNATPFGNPPPTPNDASNAASKVPKPWAL